MEVPEGCQCENIQEVHVGWRGQQIVTEVVEMEEMTKEEKL
jgi:copper oxidase (laccase) domain-containing protein